MTWNYWKSVVEDAPPSYRYLIIMTKRAGEKDRDGNVNWTRYMMTFFGPTPEAAQAKVDEFWKAEEQKAENRAAAVVKAQATRSARA